jgi:hypothetical protein
VAEFGFQLNDGQAGSKTGRMLGRVFLFLFATPFAGFGLFAIWGAVRNLRKGDLYGGLALLLFGLLFAGIGFGLMYAAVSAGRRQKAADAKWQAQTAGGSKPWLARPDWAAGRIKSSATAQMNVLFVMALAFCVIGGSIAAFVLPAELRKGNHAALFVLLFPLAGLGLFAAGVATWRSRRRFGDCYFEMAQIPAPLGGTLEGMIQTGARVHLEHGLHLKFTCLRQVTTGSGDHRSTQEFVLWQDEKVIKPEAELPEPEPGHTGIPVFFKLPADQPESITGRGDGIHWRLEARTKMAGPDFSVAFDVPVFKIAGAAVGDPAEADPTASLQESVEELRRDEPSKIAVSDGPNGREFYFPPARNLGMAIFLTLFFVIWSGFFYFMLVNKAPVLFPIVWGVTDVLLAFGLVNVWFKSSRVVINPTTVRATNRWLVFSRTREFPADSVARFDLKAGMQSGNQIFQNIKLVRRGDGDSFAAARAKYQQTGERPRLRFRIGDPGGVTVASSIANSAEAKWLVKQMNNALGRK